MLAITNYRFLAANSEVLCQFLKSGGTMRELLLNPDNSESMYIATSRAIGSSKRESHTRGQIVLAIDTLRDLVKCSAGEGSIAAKQTEYATAHVISWFEFADGRGAICVTPTGFDQNSNSRPTVVLDKHRDADAFKFFSDYFENLWGWSKSTPVDLDGELSE